MLSITETGTMTQRSDLIGCCETETFPHARNNSSLSLSLSLSLSISLSLSLSLSGWSIIEQSLIKSRSVFHRACLFEYTLRCERSASLWTESPGSLFDLPHTATGDSTAAHRTLSITQPQHKTCYVLWQFHTHWPALNIHPDPILHISQGPYHHTTYSIQKKYLTPPFRTRSQEGLHMLLICSAHTFSRSLFKISVSRLPSPLSSFIMKSSVWRRWMKAAVRAVHALQSGLPAVPSLRLSLVKSKDVTSCDNSGLI